MDRALTTPPALAFSAPSILLASGFWAAVSAFAMVAGATLLLSGEPVFQFVVRFWDIAIPGPTVISVESADTIREAIRSWGWSGIITGASLLPLAHSQARTGLFWALEGAAANLFSSAALPVDGLGGRFAWGVAGVLAFTLMVCWSLTAYEHVGWLEGEDGLSEWWSVAAYLIGAVAAALTAKVLRAGRHRWLSWFHLSLSLVLFVGAMEEISWGQRMLGWGTPEALINLNEQGETTIHNVKSFDVTIFALLFWGSVTAILGAVLRACWRRRQDLATVRLFLPSLVMAPALIMIMIWRAGSDWAFVNLPRLGLDALGYGPQGSEVPEVLLGLCIAIYTVANLRRAFSLKTRAMDPSVRRAETGDWGLKPFAHKETS